MPLTVLNLGDGAAWDAALERCRPYDFYHTHGYHALAAARGEGEPRLFVFEDGADVVCLPLKLVGSLAFSREPRAPAAQQHPAPGDGARTGPQ